MDIAGLVKVRIVVDDTDLDAGFARSEQKSEAYYRGQNARLAQAKAGYASAGDAAKKFGNDATGAAARAAVANDNIAGSAKRAALGMDGMVASASRLGTMIGSIAALLLTSALTKYADAWSDMQSRVGAAVKDMEAAPALMKRLVDIANASYSPLEQTVEVYARNVAVLRDMGKGAQEAADFTESLNHMLVVTATRGERAASVQNALSKAMAVGKLEADGLETVLANGGRVAEALAGELGTTVNGLRSMASEGKITGAVISNAVVKSLAQVREEAAQMPATIGDAFTRIRTNLTAFIGQLDKAYGASEMVASILMAVADNIDRLAIYAATAAAVFAASFAPGLVAAALAAGSLTAAMNLLRLAIARTGIGLLVVGLGEAVYQMIRLREATGSWSAAFEELGRRSEILLDGVVWVFRSATESVLSIWNGALAEMLSATEQNFSPILRYFGMMADDVATRIADLKYSEKGWSNTAKTSIGIAVDQFNKAFGDLPIPEGDANGAAGAATKAAAEQATKAYRDLISSAKARIDQMQFELKTLGQTGAAAEALRFEQDLLNKAMQDGTSISPKQREQIAALAKQYGVLSEAMSQAKLAQDLLFERDQLFRSDMDAAIAAAQRGAGLPIDMNSDVARIMRVNEALRLQKEAWEDIRNVGKSAFGEIARSAVTGFKDINDVAKNILGNLSQMLADLAITNPITNSLYGGNAPTLQSFGGIFSALFGGEMPKPAGLDGMQSVGAMSVSAGSVIINGSVVGGGGEGGPLGALSRLLSPANSNRSSASGGSASGAVDLASGLLGFNENRNGAQINSFLKAGGVNLDAMSQKWCAAFVNSSLSQIGLDGSGSSVATSFLNWGKGVNPLDVLRGDVLVKSNGLGAGQTGGHVGFATGNTRTMGGQLQLEMLSGNSKNSVATDWYDANVLAVRRSTDVLGAFSQQAGGATDALGTLGSGFDQFGKNLMNAFPSAPGGGGGMSGFSGFGAMLSAFFRSPLAAMNIMSGGTGLYASGGIANRASIFGEAGPEAAVPLPDGRSIPVTMHFSGQQGEQKAPQVNISRHYHGVPAGYEMREEKSNDSQGNIREDVFFDRLFAQAASKPGSATDKALAARGAKRKLVRR